MRRIVRNLLKELGFNNVEERKMVSTLSISCRQAVMDLLLRLEHAQHGWPGIAENDSCGGAMSALPVLMVTAEAKKENILLRRKRGPVAMW